MVAALAAALIQFRQQGGQPARRARYEAHRDVLVTGMRRLGFATLLDDAVQSPIIVTFRSPDTPEWDFPTFYRRIRERGFVIYPGKLTRIDTFRIGCIGAISVRDVEALLRAVEDALSEPAGAPGPTLEGQAAT